LIKININPDNSIVYECSIIGAGGSLFVDIGEKYITGNANTSDDLNFSAYNHNYTRANQIASRTTYLGTGAGYVYPLIDRGTNGGSDIIWNVKDFLPCFSIYEYISKIISATGRTFTSTFLNTAEFKKLYCYPNITKIELSQAQLDNKQFYVGLNSNVNINPTFTVAGTIFDVDTIVSYNKETTPFFDSGTQYSGSTAVIAYTGEYNLVNVNKFRFSFTHTNVNVAYMLAALNIESYIEKSTDGGVTWNYINNDYRFWAGSNTTNGEKRYDVGVNYTDTVAVATGSITLNAGDIVRAGAYFYTSPYSTLGLGFDFYNSANVRQAGGFNPSAAAPFGWSFFLDLISGNTTTDNQFYCLATNKEVVEGNAIDANQTLPTKIKQKDFFKSIVQAFNLYVDVDKDNENNLIIETFDEFYDADIVDYENKTDLAKEQSINPNLLEGKRYIFAYKDDADYYNTLYKNTWNETYGTEQIDVVNDFIKSDKKNELIFSATPQVGNYGMGIAMPKIYQLDGTNKKTIAANIRMLYCAVKTTTNPYTYKQQGQTDLVTNDYLYAGMEDDPFNPTVSLMFGPPKEVYYNYINAYFTTNNLYNRYHRNYLKNLINKDAKFVTKYLWLNEKDIYLFNFRNRLFIDGAYYIVNKIENYNPLELTSTKVELVKLLDTDVFTPTSVLISGDTAINAGQDIQNYRLNSSLNVGTNIQNRGTNCLAIGENIVIPESCTNLIVFGSNITADENSTGLLLNYKSYVALISQTGTAAPTVTILENTLGVVPTITRANQGNYTITATGIFNNSNKVIFIAGTCDFITGTYPVIDTKFGVITGYVDSVNTYQIYTANILTNTFEDNLLYKTSIEIRVYN